MPQDGYQHDPAFLAWQRERARRVQQNERAFRAYNERRERFEREAVAADEPIPFVCECADKECCQPLELSVTEFEATHSRPDIFTVKPGHVLPEFEEVTTRRERYWVARKFELAEVERRLVADPAGV